MSNRDPVEYINQATIDACSQPDRSLSNLTTEGWYFWDETGAYAHGPYPDEDAARAGLDEYVKYLNGED